MAIVIVIIVVIAVIAVAFLFMGGAQKSPEGTFRDYIHLYETDDLSGALKLTDAAFLDSGDFNDMVDDMTPEDDVVFSVKVKSTDVTNKEDMNTDDRDDFEDMIDGFEEEFDVTVEDFCMLDFEIEMTAEVDGVEETEDYDDEWPMIKVDGKWYIVVYSYTYMGSGGSSTPAGSWSNTEAISESEIRMTFGAFTQDIEPLDIKIFMEVNGTATGSITIPSNTESAPQTCTWTGGPTGAVVTYFDYNPIGGLINSGDYISITGLSPGTTYSFEVFHIPSDATVMMTGASPSVQTP
ncbi:MAG: hypothetical protein KAS67_06035 [Thermoplasmata archaeon]|nr:hypothetical protein [Thermoplasmata archaeon]